MPRIELTAADLRALEAQDHVTLAHWCNILNCWEWPGGLPDPEAPRYSATACRRSAIMDWIHEKVGHKLVSRLWNDDMTDQEHEDFWNRGRDPEAKARYEARLAERVEENMKRRREAVKKDINPENWTFLGASPSSIDIMDAYVSDRIFGKPYDSVLRSVGCGHRDPCSCPVDLQVGNWWRNNELPHYSTDPAVAQTVIAEVKKLGIEISSTSPADICDEALEKTRARSR